MKVEVEIGRGGGEEGEAMHSEKRKE